MSGVEEPEKIQQESWLQPRKCPHSHTGGVGAQPHPKGTLQKPNLGFSHTKRLQES